MSASQVSSGGDTGCVCRSASVGSRPGKASRLSHHKKQQLQKQQQQQLYHQQQHQKQEHPSSARSGVEHAPSPHLTPSNSVSTLVCSEPETDFEAAEQLNNTQLPHSLQKQRSLNNSRVGKHQQASADMQQQKQDYNADSHSSKSKKQKKQSCLVKSANHQQQQKQKQFARQHKQDQQHFFSSDTSASVSMV